jgi:hypothetical protein
VAGRLELLLPYGKGSFLAGESFLHFSAEMDSFVNLGVLLLLRGKEVRGGAAAAVLLLLLLLMSSLSTLCFLKSYGMNGTQSLNVSGGEGEHSMEPATAFVVSNHASLSMVKGILNLK